VVWRAVEILEDTGVDNQRVGGPPKSDEEVVNGLAAVQNRNRKTTVALSVSSPRLSMVVETPIFAGVTAVLDVGHADHLRARAHHPPAP
jgi:hypothetical protein